jgi:hypothetical protein
MLNRKIRSVLSLIVVVALVLLSEFFLPASRALAASSGKIMDTAPEHVEYTRVIRLSNGTLLAAANYFYATNNSVIRFYKSTNDGGSFSLLSEFRDTADSSLVIGAETIFEYPNGTVLLSYIAWNAANELDGEKLKVWKSTNGGVSWTFQAQLEDMSTWQWEPEFGISSDGKLQIYYSFTPFKASNSIGSQVIARRESSDGGATWSSRFTAVGDSTHNMGMPRVVKVGSTYYMAFEYYEDSTSVHVVASNDGKTWPCCGKAMQLPAPGGWMHSAPVLTYANGVLIGMGKEYLSQNSYSYHPQNGNVLLYSKDGGNTWNQMATPFTIQYPGDDHDNWSSALLPVSNNSQLLLISPTSPTGRPRDVQYNTAPITMRITSRLSSKVVDVSQQSTSDAGNVDQWTWNGGTNQQWSFVDAGIGGGYVNIVNFNSGKCLDVSQNSTADGANVDQWTCNGGQNQQWQWVAHGNYFQLIGRQSGKCLDVSQNSTADGANLDIWTCNNGQNQDWTRQ